MDQWITAISTAVIALSAGVTAYLTRGLIQENRRLRKVETEPKVVVYLDHHPHLWESINFVLANVGRGPARNVSFRFLTDEEDFKSHEVALRNSAERTPLGFLPQGETYTAFFGTGTDLMAKPRLRPFDVEVSYEDVEGKSYRERFKVDVAQFEGMESLGTPPAQDSADALQKISRSFGQLVRLGRLKVETMTAAEVQQRNREVRLAHLARNGQRTQEAPAEQGGPVMEASRDKRAVVLVGAGASLDFGAPSTSELTGTIERRVLANEYLENHGGSRAYLEIKETLAGYLCGGDLAVNYEHIYHCANELQFIEPTPRAVNEFRPILSPFFKPQTRLEKHVLSGLARCMAEFIFSEISAICEKPKVSLEPLAEFLGNLRQDHITRVYTTNYDDFLWQAGCDLYTGYGHGSDSKARKFDGVAFWRANEEDSVFHLHGSVHLGFLPSQDPDDDFGTLSWFDDRAAALEHSSYSGSGDQRMDGSQTMRTAVITGLDKLACIQRQPFSHYYASIAQDLMTADLIFVIGCGLGDLHVNTCLKEARRKKPRTPLILVDYWPDGFLEDTEFEIDPKAAAMVHSLRMPVTEHSNTESYRSSWILDEDRTCAIWDKGFVAFLDAADELEDVLRMLRTANSG